MKEVIVIIGIIVGAWFLFQKTQMEKLNPEVITDPVYAEVRMTMDVERRNVEVVLFLQTANEMECKESSRVLLERLKKYKRSGKSGAELWVFKSSECKSELSPRYAKLFDNEPTFLTYLSLSRGNRLEREGRIIFWGLSVEESNIICDLSPKLQDLLEGDVTCIRAAKQKPPQQQNPSRR
ncbi:MAG: hypothetical protein FWG81_03215 [Betaproteobacteria bacterium]|nr:hypothetical protein [Betaproteobacteria bacterium]